MCSFIPQSIGLQVSTNKTDLDEVIFPFLMRKITHTWVYIGISQYGFSKAWVNLFLGWNVKFHQPMAILGGREYIQRNGTHGYEKPKIFTDTWSLNSDQFQEDHGDNILPPQIIQSSKHLCPRIQGPSTLTYETFVPKNTVKLTSKAATPGLRLLLHLTLFSSFSSVSILCKSFF